MGLQLGTSLMEIVQGRAGQLELPAGLQGNRATALAAQADDVLAVEQRLPAEASQALEQRANPVGALIGHGAKVHAPEHEFLVLGADAPIRFGLATRGKILDEL